MDVFLIIIGFFCCLIGIIGSFLPILPGPSISWIGILLLYITKTIPINYWVLCITFILMITISLLDFVIPSKGVKEFGGSKFGIYGTNIGLIIGLFFPPLGLILGPFLGAFIGELAFNSQDKKRALKSALGALVSFLLSTFMSFLFCTSMLILFLYVYFTH